MTTRLLLRSTSERAHAGAGADTAPALRRGRAALLMAGLLALTVLGLWAARAWQQTSRREAYLPQLEAQARADPYDGALQALLGARLIEAHEQSAGADALRRALAAGEHSEMIWQCLAAANAAAGNRARALTDLRLGRQALGNSPALDDAARRAEALGPHPDPALLAQTIAPQGPAPLVAAYTRGSALNRLASWWGRRHPDQSGFTTRQEIARQRPGDAQAQRLWGLALLQNRRLPEAGEALARAVRLDPHSAAIHLALAQALVQEGQESKAGLEYVAALRFHPDWLPALLGLGQSALRAGLEYADQAFTRAVQVAPDSPDAQMGLGSSSLESGMDIDGAIRAFQSAARLAPGRTEFYGDYAEALRKGHRLEEAEAILRRRLSVAPQDALCHYRLGGLLMQRDPSPARLTEAEAETRTALGLAPHTAVAEIQLGQLLLGSRHIPAALTVLQQAAQDDPNDVHGLNCLARAYGQAGDMSASEQVSARARIVFDQQQRIRVLEGKKMRNPTTPAFHAQLASLYAQTGEADKARQERRLLALLTADPTGTARSITDFNASMKLALGSH